MTATLGDVTRKKEKPDLTGFRMGNIRTYRPGSHAGIVVLRLAAATVGKGISDLASLTEPASLTGAVAVPATRTVPNPPSLTDACFNS